MLGLWRRNQMFSWGGLCRCPGAASLAAPVPASHSPAPSPWHVPWALWLGRIPPNPFAALTRDLPTGLAAEARPARPQVWAVPGDPQPRRAWGFRAETVLLGSPVVNNLPVQWTWVPSLVWDDSTCCKASKPESHNYWAHVPQPLKPKHPRACALQPEKPLQ